MKKKYWIGILIAIVLIMLLLILNPFGWSLTEKRAPCLPSSNKTTVGLTVVSDSIIKMNRENATLIERDANSKALHECQAGAQKIERENDLLKKENDLIKTVSASNEKKFRTEIDALKKQIKALKAATTPATTPAPTNSGNNSLSSYAPAPSSSQSTNTMIATNKYVGKVIGDAGCTFDANSFLFFYVKTRLINSISNRTQSWTNLNSESGPQGEEVGEYTYYKTPVLILTSMLSKDWSWTVYLGDNTQYGYDMWLWHELIKLNPNIKNQPEITNNGMGGYQYTSKVNYDSK